jgi:general secretion pathway protein A
MYEEYFGLKKKPFSIVPDPACFYMSERYREALAHMLYGATGDGGFVLLTGEVGTGKTTVCRRLFELIPEGTDVAFVLNPKVTAEELLATICDEFALGRPEGATSVRTLTARINDYLLDAHEKGRRAVLVIEEAQNLTPEVLEQVRLLTNLETTRRKLLQVVMVGQPELREMLAKPQQRPLSQRITARCHLGPLSRGEVQEYIAYRLAAAGAGRNRIFPPSTVRKMYGLTKGIPRLINVICDRALLGAFVQEKEFVDVRTLKRAAREVLAEEKGKRKKARLCIEAAGALLLLCVALSALHYTPPLKQWAPPLRQWAPPLRQWALSRLHTRPDRPPLTAKAAASSAASETALPTHVSATAPAAAPGEGEKMAPAERATLSRPGGRSGAGTREMAYRALFRQWHVPYGGQDSRSATDQAEGAGLRCLMGRGGVSDLLEMNRPAVLRLTDEAGLDYYALLTAADGKTATVLLAGETKTVDMEEINRRWSGDYLLLWRAPPGYYESLKPGDSGPAVAWLEKRLAVALQRPAPAGEQRVYDKTVMTQVKEFQIAAGLTPVGIAGPKTIMRLCDAMPDNRDPVLRGGKGIK